jgi:hypothetical protein
MMKQDSALILSGTACLGGIGMLYFLSLVCHVPFIITVLLVIAFCIMLLNAARSRALEPSMYSWPAVAVIAAGVFLITNRTYYLATKWGEWDAWGMWNFHAKFLTDGRQWTNLFRSTQYDHADYPLGLPALLAFFSRMCGGHGMLHISFAIHFLITLLIPLLIFLLLYRKNFIIAAATLILFATDDFYLSRGVSQYADTMLAAWFLMALVAISHAAHDKRMVALSAFFAGCAAWTKNEGIVLAALLLIFYANVFFSRKYIRYSIAGILLPLVTLAVFKIFYAPDNDILRNSHGGLFQQLSDRHRYVLVWAYFRRNGSEYFMRTWIFILLYAMASVLQKRRPDKQMLLLLACLAAYMFAYILTPYDPDWHLNTSQNRLMHQLMPAMMYVIALRLCDVRFPLLRKKLL